MKLLTLLLSLILASSAYGQATIKVGTLDVTRYVMLVDATAGTPETGYTITDLDLQYTRNRLAPSTKVDATALAATDSAHGDNQAIQVDATSSPGLYRIDWPDAAFAAGVNKVILVVSGPGLHPAVEEIQLVQTTLDDMVTSRGEPGQGAPPMAASIYTKIDYLYKYLRNKKTQTDSLFSLFGDDGTTVHSKAVVSDSAGTTTVGEQESGP